MDPITQTPEQEDADFTAAFAEFSPEEGAAAPVVKTPEEITVEEAAKAAAAPAKTPEEIAAEEAAKAAPAAKTPEEIAAEEAAAVAAAPDWKSEIDQLKSNLAAERAAREAAAAEAAKPAPAQVKELPLYSADEQAVLTKYQEDWPDVSKAEALMRRAEYKDLVGYIFQQVRAELAPLQDFVSTQAPRTQYSEITKLVPDYDDVRDKALAWVDSQPAYLKAAYKQVTDGGSPEEVADLLNRFKKETNYASPAAPTPSASPAAGAATSTTPAAPAKPAAPALPAAATKAAAKLAVVKTGRTEQESGTSDDDFDGAFAKYAANEDKQNTRR
jgi:hypothetical protein